MHYKKKKKERIFCWAYKKKQEDKVNFFRSLLERIWGKKKEYEKFDNCEREQREEREESGKTTLAASDWYKAKKIVEFSRSCFWESANEREKVIHNNHTTSHQLFISNIVFPTFFSLFFRLLVDGLTSRCKHLSQMNKNF